MGDARGLLDEVQEGGSEEFEKHKELALETTAQALQAFRSRGKRGLVSCYLTSRVDAPEARDFDSDPEFLCSDRV